MPNEAIVKTTFFIRPTSHLSRFWICISKVKRTLGRVRYDATQVTSVAPNRNIYASDTFASSAS
jgi:hypothetical protein